jgi:GxxExxY protein
VALIHEKLSGQIIGVAMQVLNEMKPGLDEKLYERAMIIELPAARSYHRIAEEISRVLPE